MFIQVIEGKVSDPSKAKAALDRWDADLAPSAVGWLGTTAGVTADGTFVALARFASEEEARRNSDRPEQGEWWAETERIFDGEVTFADSSEIDVDMVGDPDKARFVQVMRGRVSDPDRVRKLMREGPEDWTDFRPDLLGTVTAVQADGEMITAAYFTSEQEARVGEKKESPPEMQQAMEEMGSLTVGEWRYLDLTDPWLSSPR